MPDRKFETLLGRLLPADVRRDLFDPARHDLEADRIASGRHRNSFWYHLQLVRLLIECWRVHSIPEFHSAPPAERTTVFLNDLRYAFRSWLRAPGFALAAILTLVLGVGASVAVFSLVEAVLIRPLPYPGADQLAILRHRDQRTGITKEFIAIGDYVDLAQRENSLEAIAGYGGTFRSIVDQGETVRVQALMATPGLLELLRIAPAMGRTIQPDDARPKSAPVVLVSDNFWRTRLGADEKVIGRSIRIEQGEAQIVGVLPPGFAFPPDRRPDLLLPMGVPAQAPSDRKSNWVFAIGRLKPGIEIEQAGASLARLSGRLEQEFPTSNRGSEYYLVSLRDQLAGGAKTALLIGLAAVGLVLLIACANVANLLLARSLARRREMAVRLALGAGHGRLTAQLLTESLALAMVAGVLGTLLAHWAVRASTSVLPPSLRVVGLEGAQINGAVLSFAVVVSAVTSLLCGWLSALSARSASASGALVAATRVTASQSMRRSLSVLVVAEVVVTTILLIGAGLLVRTFQSLANVDPGFRGDHVLTLSVQFPASRYASLSARQALFPRVMAEALGVPGITEIGAGVVVPLTGNNWTVGFERIEKPVAERERPPEVGWQTASGGYFRALGIPLRSGRLFDERDLTGPPVVIVSEAIERQFYPNERAVGHVLKMGDRKAEIVGVVGDIRRADLRDQPRPDMYFPLEGNPSTQLTLFVKTQSEPLAITNSLVARLRTFEPATVITGRRSMDEIASDSIRTTRLSLWLLGVFALIALTLSCVGIYGVMSYLVGQRTKEIGTRVAMGASTGDIVWLVMRHGTLIAGLGVIIGAVAGLAASRALGSILYGVSPTDPLTVAGSALVLLATATLACYLPARRAAGLDPVRSLSEG